MQMLNTVREDLVALMDLLVGRTFRFPKGKKVYEVVNSSAKEIGVRRKDHPGGTVYYMKPTKHVVAQVIVNPPDPNTLPGPISIKKIMSENYR